MMAKALMLQSQPLQRLRAATVHRVVSHRVATRSRSIGAPVQALFGRFGRGADGHATQQARIQTLNRYGITTYDFGTRYLQQGCVGDDVAQLQNYLREEGIMRADDAYPGYFGEVTEAAVIKWQNRHDLPATGAFGDLARETYIQKQELRMQSTLSTSDDLTMLHEVERPTVLGSVAGSLFSGLLLLAAGYAALTQAKAWWERRQQQQGTTGGEGFSDWQAELSATLGPTTSKAWSGIATMLGKRAAPATGGDSAFYGGADGGEELGGGEVPMLDTLWSAPPESIAAVEEPSKKDPPTPSSHGNYFRAGGMAQIRKEIEQRKAEEGSATLELPPQPTRSSRVAERPTRTPPAKPAIAEPGSYFGGAIKRPQFPTLKGRMLGRKQDATGAAPDTVTPRSKDTTTTDSTPVKTAAWDAWSTPADDAEQPQPVDLAQTTEPLPSSWMSTEDSAFAVSSSSSTTTPGFATTAAASRAATAPTNSGAATSAPLGAPVRDAMTWSSARETAVEPRRSVQAADVSTLVKRLAAKKPAQQKGEGEIWVSNTRFTADGAPVEAPSNAARSPFGTPMESLGGFTRRRSANGSDYKMVTNATPKPPAPMPPRSTTAPLQAAGLGGGTQRTGSDAQPGSNNGAQH